MPRRPAAQTAKDDELDDEWEWIYRAIPSQSGRLRNESAQHIVGARNGEFECQVGDCVLLKADGANRSWVAIITDFVEADEDGDMAANFLWFSPENEIRNGPRKRTDFLPVCASRSRRLRLLFPRTISLTHVYVERIVYYYVLRYKPSRFHQWQSECNVCSCLFA